MLAGRSIHYNTTGVIPLARGLLVFMTFVAYKYKSALVSIMGAELGETHWSEMKHAGRTISCYVSKLGNSITSFKPSARLLRPGVQGAGYIHVDTYRKLLFPDERASSVLAIDRLS